MRVLPLLLPSGYIRVDTGMVVLVLVACAVALLVVAWGLWRLFRGGPSPRRDAALALALVFTATVMFTEAWPAEPWLSWVMVPVFCVGLAIAARVPRSSAAAWSSVASGVVVALLVMAGWVFTQRGYEPVDTDDVVPDVDVQPEQP